MRELEKIDLENIAGRLKLIRGKKSRGKFGKLIGIHPNTLANYENALRTLGADALIGLTDIGINPMWVLTGEGNILIDENELGPGFYENKQYREFYEDFRSHLQNSKKNQSIQESTSETNTYRKRDQEKKAGSSDPTFNDKAGSDIKDYSAGTGSFMEAFAHIPLFDVKASAGNGSVVHEEEATDALMFKREWIHNELHSSPANLYLIYVEGESMEPVLRPGDVILVDHTDNIAKRDGIYVIRMGESLLVKRLQRLPNHRLKVTSDNPAYEPFEISLDFDLQNEMSIIGRVVWSGRRH
ncbi:S24 family peptidase [uncultured Methylophaga sp.]|uniref:XRE family transcriptional regulator n=1 Tax=uncultured Methylophaga sp. TaxID=285271 RepID=UPI00262DF0AC|nr:S24 family peptidase [uncultured Methylophaga sp.]